MATVIRLPNRIKFLRMQRMMNQKDLAKALNISQSAVCDMEQGKVFPRLQTALNMERILGEPIRAIFVPMDYTIDCAMLPSEPASEADTASETPTEGEA